MRARDRDRAVDRCWLAHLRWTWPGVVLVVGSVQLVRLSAWSLAPAWLGLAMVIVGSWRSWRIARPLLTDLQTEEPPCPTSSPS